MYIIDKTSRFVKFAEKRLSLLAFAGVVCYYKYRKLNNVYVLRTIVKEVLLC